MGRIIPYIVEKYKMFQTTNQKTPLSSFSAKLPSVPLPLPSASPHLDQVLCSSQEGHVHIRCRLGLGFFDERLDMTWHDSTDKERPSVAVSLATQLGPVGSCEHANGHADHHKRKHMWLVGVGGIPTPLNKIRKSVGMMTFPTEWKKKTCSKPPTRWGPTIWRWFIAVYYMIFLLWDANPP